MYSYIEKACTDVENHILISTYFLKICVVIIAYYVEFGLWESNYDAIRPLCNIIIR